MSRETAATISETINRQSLTEPRVIIQNSQDIPGPAASSDLSLSHDSTSRRVCAILPPLPQVACYSPLSISERGKNKGRKKALDRTDLCRWTNQPKLDPRLTAPNPRLVQRPLAYARSSCRTRVRMQMLEQGAQADGLFFENEKKKRHRQGPVSVSSSTTVRALLVLPWHVPTCRCQRWTLAMASITDAYMGCFL